MNLGEYCAGGSFDAYNYLGAHPVFGDGKCMGTARRGYLPLLLKIYNVHNYPPNVLSGFILPMSSSESAEISA